MNESTDRKEKFTPGPWGFYLSANTGLPADPTECIVINTIDLPTPSEQASVCLITDKASMNERDRANALLISAAPDMYAALSCVLAIASTPTTKCELVYVDFTEIRAALAKARGES